MFEKDCELVRPQHKSLQVLKLSRANPPSPPSPSVPCPVLLCKTDLVGTRCFPQSWLCTTRNRKPVQQGMLVLYSCAVLDKCLFLPSFHTPPLTQLAETEVASHKSQECCGVLLGKVTFVLVTSLCEVSYSRVLTPHKKSELSVGVSTLQLLSLVGPQSR